MASYINNALYSMTICWHPDANNSIERFGDRCLNTSCVTRRMAWTINPRFGEKAFNAKILGDSSDHVVKTALRVLASPFFIAIGLACKVISLYDHESRRRYFTPSLCLNESFDAILDAPEQYVAVTRDPIWSGDYAHLPPFDECACTQGHNFDRSLNSRRKDLETQMVNYFKNYDPERPISYMGLGCGGMLQDLINVGKLLKAGHKSLSVCLVDTGLDSNRVTYFTRFLVEYASRIGSRIEVFSAKGIEQFIAQYPRMIMDYVSAVDFDEMYTSRTADTLEKAHALLNPRGSMVLSHQKNDFIFSRSKLERLAVHINDPREMEPVELILNDILGLFEANNKPITLTLFGDKTTLRMCSLLIPRLVQKGRREIYINCVDDCKWTKEDFEKFLRLISPEAVVTVNLLKNEEDYLVSSTKEDVLMYFGMNAKSEEDFRSKIKVFRERSANSVSYLNSGGGFWRYLNKDAKVMWASEPAAEEQIKQFEGIT